MNGLHTRNALHQYHTRHSGAMPEMDAIQRSDTVREITQYTDDDAPTGAAVVWGVVCLFFALALLLWVAT